MGSVDTPNFDASAKKIGGVPPRAKNVQKSAFFDIFVHIFGQKMVKNGHFFTFLKKPYAA